MTLVDILRYLNASQDSKKNPTTVKKGERGRISLFVGVTIHCARINKLSVRVAGLFVQVTGPKKSIDSFKNVILFQLSKISIVV